MPMMDVNEISQKTVIEKPRLLLLCPTRRPSKTIFGFCATGTLLRRSLRFAASEQTWAGSTLACVDAVSPRMVIRSIANRDLNAMPIRL
ncbi:MAG: hypothetical protein DMF21_01095 [Verrucomicrobia bacterium]|nr:MAG: hypothetical protein DMF21_01095 [Verrucomicrobiota bacterium]